MSDRLSDMPWDILDKILSHLPIKDAVRTSILSKKWRNKWVDLSMIIIDDSTIDFNDWDQLAKFVYNVLLAHRGQIDKFMLSSRSFGSVDDVDHWISFLSRIGVKKLILDVNFDYGYTLPDCLFSCQQLSCLYLRDCSFFLPSTFNGFTNLVGLQLESCVINKEVFEILIRSCRILETLVLSGYDDLESLSIYAPYLKSLYIEGRFISVYVENSPHLTDVSLKMSPNWGMPRALVPPLGFVSCLERLTLFGCLLTGIPAACDNLKVLELSDVYFDELDEISVFLSLLSSSPNLKALSISVSGPFHEEVHKLMTAQSQLSYHFNHLQIVKIYITVAGIGGEWIRCWRSDLEFIKLVLARSPVLEKMHVCYPCGGDDDLWFMSRLLSFERASEKLIFKYSSNPYVEDYWPTRHYDVW